MTASSTNSTFKQGGFSDTTGVDTVIQQLTVELLAADPSDLSTNFPRIWVNTTTDLMKLTTNGTDVFTVTAT